MSRRMVGFSEMCMSARMICFSGVCMSGCMIGFSRVCIMMQNRVFACVQACMAIEVCCRTMQHDPSVYMSVTVLTR